MVVFEFGFLTAIILTRRLDIQKGFKPAEGKSYLLRNLCQDVFPLFSLLLPSFLTHRLPWCMPTLTCSADVVRQSMFLLSDIYVDMPSLDPYHACAQCHIHDFSWETSVRWLSLPFLTKLHLWELAPEWRFSPDHVIAREPSAQLLCCP